MNSANPTETLLREGPRVLNVGVRSFAQTLEAVGAPHLHIDWQPPAQGDPDPGAALALLAADDTPGSLGKRIRGANAEALRPIFAADQTWDDVRPAREIGPEMDARKQLYHSGPPIAWEWMSGPMQGAAI